MWDHAWQEECFSRPSPAYSKMPQTSSASSKTGALSAWLQDSRAATLTPASSISMQDQNDLHPFSSSSDMTAIGIKTRQMPAEDEQRFRRCNMSLSTGVWTLIATMKNRRPNKFEEVSPDLEIYLQCCFNGLYLPLEKLDLHEILAEYNPLMAARDERNEVADSNACNVPLRSVSFEEVANKRDHPHKRRNHPHHHHHLHEACETNAIKAGMLAVLALNSKLEQAQQSTVVPSKTPKRSFMQDFVF